MSLLIGSLILSDDTWNMHESSSERIQQEYLSDYLYVHIATTATEKVVENLGE